MLLVPETTTRTRASATATATSKIGDVLYRLGLERGADFMYSWSYVERRKQMEETR